MNAEATWVDLAFPIHADKGGQIAADYALMLAQCVSRILPWWITEPNVGVHPLKGLSACGGAWLVGGRAHLTLRVPECRVSDCEEMVGQVIDLDVSLRLGAPRARSLLAHPVVYSACVSTGSSDEAGFVGHVRSSLDERGISGQEIVGKQSALRASGGPVVGFSLMIAGLSLDDSLLVQEQGLGLHRSLGCGIFVPHRSINAVGM
jgi:CRISPR-associated protein Cas6